MIFLEFEMGGMEERKRMARHSLDEALSSYREALLNNDLHLISFYSNKFDSMLWMAHISGIIENSEYERYSFDYANTADELLGDREVQI